MHQQGALQRLKKTQISKRQATDTGQQHLACASDADNEAYMQHFEQAFSALSATEPGSLPPRAASKQTRQSLPGCTNHKQAAPPAVPAVISGMIHSPAWPDSDLTAARPSGRNLHTSDASTTGISVGSSTSIASGWLTGPVDPSGTLVQLSERPIMCSAASWGSNEVVVGSCDHASYVVDVRQGKKKRTLYTKTTGHTEWVTCVCYLPGNRILSGGMDGRLWLWPSGGSTGNEIKSAHSAPVSKVASLTPLSLPGTASTSGSRASHAASGRAPAPVAGPQLAVSCSYDKTVRVWDVGNVRAKDVAVLSGHSGPVLEMDVQQGCQSIVTGDRKGNIMCWDLGCGSSSWGAAAAHAGHITALTWQYSAARQQQQQQQEGADSRNCVISGGQDGHVRVWDGRSGGCVAEQAVHVDERGQGAVGSIIAGCGANCDLTVTCGADMTLRVLEPSMSYQPMHTVKVTDFPYSLAAVGNIAICGCGDGSVHVIDVDSGKTVYALGAGKAAVRAIEVSHDTLVCAGDDGHVVTYSFS